jgi:hypothetical protein
MVWKIGLRKKSLNYIGDTMIMKKVSLIIISIVFLLSLFNGCIQKVEEPVTVTTDPTQMIVVPDGNGTPVLIDGIISEGEWDDAYSVVMAENINILFKKYRGHMFIAMHYDNIIGPMTDLNISVDDTLIYQFHISAQLGEIVYAPGTHEDSLVAMYRYGDTKDWYANEIRWDAGKRQYLMDSLGKTADESIVETMYFSNGTEFQFKLSKFNSNNLKFRVKFIDFGNWDNPYIFPENTKENEIENWTTLVVE